MSLARTLMNGVTESSVIDTTGFEYSDAVTESYFLDAACESLFTDIINIDKAYHIADIMGEVKVATEGADCATILEGIVTDTAEKLKNAFKKFWAKLKDWFAKIKKLFNSFFLDNQKFVKEFKKELLVKKKDGFTYHGFHFTLETGNSKVDSVVGKIWDKVDELASGMKDSAKAKDKTALANAINAIDKTGELTQDSTEFQEDFIKTCGVSGASTASELNDELFQIYRNGEEKPEDIDDFEAESVQDMLKALEEKKFVSDVENDEKDFEKQINMVIKALDEFKSGETDVDVKNKALQYVQKLSSYTTSLLTVGKNALNIKTSAYRDAQKQYRRVLGEFVRFKPAKEGFEPENAEPATESMLEAALKFV